MRTFVFVSENSSAVLTLSASSYEEAMEELTETVKHPADFRVEDEEGEDEDE